MGFISPIKQEVHVTTQQTKSSNELAEDRTDMATGRTVMAADRSLMAWIRTALSMISFGFTIYKILEGLQKVEGPMGHDYSPRTVGLFLTGLGTVSMVAGTIEYWQRIKTLREFHPIKIWRPTFVMALIMSVTGLFFFVSIITRLL